MQLRPLDERVFAHTRCCGGGSKYKLAQGEQPATRGRRIGSELRRNARVLESCHIRLRDGRVVMPNVGGDRQAGISAKRLSAPGCPCRSTC